MAWFLVLTTAFIFATIVYMAVRFDKIDAVKVIYIGDDGREEGGGGADGANQVQDNGRKLKKHKRKLVHRSSFGVENQ